MSKVAKYRRQVSEDPDIDSLLSTLSPEEMEELEKELDVVDSDGSIPLEPSQKNQTENSPASPQNCDAVLNHCEKETKKRIQREHSVDETRLAEKKQEARDGEEKGKEAPAKDPARKRDTGVGKDSKKEESAQKTDPKVKAEAESKTKDGKAINDKVKAMEKKLMGKDKKEEEKDSAVKKEKGKDKKEEEKGSVVKKDTGKDKKEEEKGSVLKKFAGKDKKEEEKSSAAKKETGKDKKEEEKGSALKKGTEKDKKEEEKSSGSKKEAEKDKKEEEKKGKDKKEEKKEKDKKEEEKSSDLKKSKEDEKEKPQPEAEKAAEEKQEAKATAAAESSDSKPATGSSPEQAKEDEASSIFDELIEKVKNNDAEVTEVNVNNSDCINNETLVRFTEALEFNTVVKLFALANTRADDHVAFAIAIMLKSNKVLTSINLDSNHITGKGILAIFRALLQNNTLTELRFHNQRHICGGKTEMEIAKLLKENTTLLKLGYHFELAGPRMTVTNLLSRNMDKQRQKRLQEQKLAQERGEKKDLLEVPKVGAPKGSPKGSPQPSPKASPKNSPKKGGAPAAPPPPPPPLAPPLINENLRNSLSPATQRKMGDRALPVQEKNSRDQLLAAIRSSNLKQLKKVDLPKLLQ
uniref:Leiomodin-1 n=1 Tax=Anser brachyrhynchus TaxID=132585 RepID=A0A8B9C163_9AVES